MRSNFTRLDKGVFLTVHRYTVVSCITINCRPVTKFCLVFENLFRRSSGMQWFDFWTLIEETVGPVLKTWSVWGKIMGAWIPYTPSTPCTCTCHTIKPSKLQKHVFHHYKGWKRKLVSVCFLKKFKHQNGN